MLYSNWLSGLQEGPCIKQPEQEKNLSRHQPTVLYHWQIQRNQIYTTTNQQCNKLMTQPTDLLLPVHVCQYVCLFVHPGWYVFYEQYIVDSHLSVSVPSLM